MARQIQRFNVDHDYSMKAKLDGYWVRYDDVAPFLVEEKFTSANTGSPKLPPLEEIHDHIKLFAEGQPSVKISEIVNEVYSFILRRQLRANA